MTQADFVERFRHELGGMVMDAMTQRDGSHAAMFVRQILKKVDVKLVEMYGALTAGKPIVPAVNVVSHAKKVVV